MAKYRFDEIARECRDTFKGDSAGVKIVGLEHIVPNDMLVKNFEVDTENTFTKSFKKGQILFGRRRAYQQKAAVATFDGICSGDITVIEAIPGKVEPDLLPFIIQNDRFFEHAVKGSAGSLSPRVKWEHLASYEIELPSLPEQKRLAEKLWAAYRLKESYKKLLVATDEMVKSQFIEMFGNFPNRKKIKEVATVTSGKSIPTEFEDIKGDIAYVKVADFNNVGNEKYIVNSSRYVANDSARLSKLIPIGTTIFAKNGAASKSNKKRLTKIECCIDMNTMALIPNKNLVDPRFLYSVIEALDVAMFVRDGAIPSMSPKLIEEALIPIPEMNSQIDYISICEQADKSKFELKKSIEQIDRVIKALMQ